MSVRKRRTAEETLRAFYGKGTGEFDINNKEMHLRLQYVQKHLPGYYSLEDVVKIALAKPVRVKLY